MRNACRFCSAARGPLWFWQLALFLLLCIALAGSGHATPQQALRAAPDALQPWRDWVQYGQEFRNCPMLYDAAGNDPSSFVCAWPGELVLQVGAHQAQMAQKWQVQAPSWIALPGDARMWPQDVRVNGQAMPVVDRMGAPSLYLQEGEHTVTASIVWQERPSSLRLPDATGLVALFLDGRRIMPVDRSGHLLALGRAASGDAAREADSLDLQIYRKLSDGIPVRITSQLNLKVSGRAREVTLADVLPEDMIPTGIRSRWPARLDARGQLQIQVQPGESQIVIEARAGSMPESVSARPPEPAQEEVWSYEAAPPWLRVTTALPQSPALSVDPRQSGVPDAWQQLPAFAMSQGAALLIQERSRGLPLQETQRLHLQREMWLDFSGQQFFARDRIEGQMQQGWRLDTALPYTLQNADSYAGRSERVGNTSIALNTLAAARGEALLVTHGSAPELTGVEWRSPRITLNAGVRLDAAPGQSVEVTGWQQTFDSVTTQLHLPYGYVLVAAPGADTTQSWLARWNFLDIFLAAFITLLAWRLLGVVGGTCAALYLFLSMPEPNAPLWTLGAVLALSLLKLVLPQRRWLSRSVRWASWLAMATLVLAVIAFIPAQLRMALYPQLESGGRNLPTDWMQSYTGYSMSSASGKRAGEFRTEAVPAPPPPSVSAAPLYKGSVADSSEPAAALALESSMKKQRYAQSTVTQTGSGEPGWRIGHLYELRWSGPVLAQQQWRPVISPPWLTRSLRVLMVLALCWLLWCTLRTMLPARGAATPTLKQTADGPDVADTGVSSPPAADTAPPASADGHGHAARALAAVCIVLAALCAAGPRSAAHAQEAVVFPPQSLLDAWQLRLQQAPECAPSCASIASAAVHADAQRITLQMEVHAATPVALPLPQPQQNLSLMQVRMDDVALNALRNRNGAIFIPVQEGVHRLELDYAVSGDATSLSFDLQPRHIEAHSQQWQIDGLDENRLMSSTLRLTRLEATPATDAPETASAGDSLLQQLPAFVQVQRHIDLDMDWTVSTRVVRMAPQEGGISASVPLLPGEHITTAGVRTENQQAVVSLGQNDSVVQWFSRLERDATLRLSAPPMHDSVEVWSVRVGPSLHLRWQGVPETLHTQDASSGEQIFHFYPLPGETLELTVTQPVAVEGGERAIDEVNLSISNGERATQYDLSFLLRASRGGEHTITLPPFVDLLSVRRNGEELSLRAENRALTLPVQPGPQVYTLSARQATTIPAWMQTLQFDLGLPSANVNIHMDLCEQRWLLASSGPAVGPAVLYWGELLVALALALLLARLPMTSLRLHQWLLLVLGFSTFSWGALLFVAAWLFVLDWRQRTGELAHWTALRFNAMQIALVLLTLLAILCFAAAIHTGLLSTPHMGVRGYGSYGNSLSWFADRSGALLPSVTIISLPMWAYRVAMLLWAIWLAQALIRWLHNGLNAWMRGGYWRALPRKPKPGKRNAKASRPPPPPPASEIPTLDPELDDPDDAGAHRP